MPESAMIWNLILSGFAGMVIWWIRASSSFVFTPRVLVSKTREEIAKEYARKDDVERDIEKLMDRFDKLETKLDNMMERICR